MLLEHLVHVAGVVLARGDDEDAGTAELRELALEILVGETEAVLAELDPAQADLADDASPEDVVEVDGHDLSGQASGGGDVLGHRVGQSGQALRVQAHAGQVPEAGVAVRGRGAARRPLPVHDDDPRRERAERPHLGEEPLDSDLPALGRRGVEHVRRGHVLRPERDSEERRLGSPLECRRHEPLELALRRAE